VCHKAAADGTLLEKIGLAFGGQRIIAFGIGWCCCWRRRLANPPLLGCSQRKIIEVSIIRDNIKTYHSVIPAKAGIQAIIKTPTQLDSIQHTA